MAADLMLQRKVVQLVAHLQCACERKLCEYGDGCEAHHVCYKAVIRCTAPPIRDNNEKRDTQNETQSSAAKAQSGPAEASNV